MGLASLSEQDTLRIRTQALIDEIAPHRGRTAGWAEWWSPRAVEWAEHLRTLDRLCWYLCRHGHQDYEKVRRWPLSWIIRGTRAISDLLEKEYGGT